MKNTTRSTSQSSQIFIQVRWLWKRGARPLWQQKGWAGLRTQLFKWVNTTWQRPEGLRVKGIVLWSTSLIINGFLTLSSVFSWDKQPPFPLQIKQTNRKRKERKGNIGSWSHQVSTCGYDSITRSTSSHNATASDSAGPGFGDWSGAQGRKLVKYIMRAKSYSLVWVQQGQVVNIQQVYALLFQGLDNGN